ncbi:flagellar assembly protein FliW [Gorillibacterium sp. CAU 1737]|uniref:flagellar assembly protein FliW n=1 Tax=Gorillibacterium sp. CAU 1737 TaxID=3140362 RepID=UPI00325FFC9A
MAYVQLATAACGPVEIEENDIVTFPHGVPGFEEIHRFVLIKPEPELPFSYLQAVDELDLAFVVTDPFGFFADYEFELSEADQSDLSAEREDQLVVLTILTVRDDLAEATANLFAPVVINWETKKGKQVVLHDSGYSTKHPLLPAVAQEGRG